MFLHKKTVKLGLFFLLFFSAFSRVQAVNNIFEDGFEQDLSAWDLIEQGSNTISTSDQRSKFGSSSLKLNYIRGDGNYLQARKSFSQQTNTVLRAWFYDNMDATKGVGIGLILDNSTGTAIGVETGRFPNHYYIRHNSYSSTFNSGVERSQGWHLFEIIVTPNGAYTKIDNQFLDFKNADHTQVSSINIYATWDLTSTTYIDGVQLIKRTTNVDQAQADVVSKFVDIYGRTDFSGLYPELGLDEPVGHGNDLRSLLDTSYGLVLDWEINNNQTSYDRGLELLEDALSHGHWHAPWVANELNNWSVAVPTYRLIRLASYYWPELSLRQKEQVLLIIEQTGDEFLTRQPESGWQGDTKAEENAWNASFLTAASQFFNTHYHAVDWKDKARCFGYHTLTRGSDSSYCGIKTQTLNDDFTLQNHNQNPNPVYTTSAVHLLGESTSIYHALGKSIPSQFKHNVANVANKLSGFISPTYHYRVSGNLFSDWSGITDTYYNGTLASDYVNQKISGASLPSQAEVWENRSLFYPEIVSETVTKPVSSISNFDQTDRKSDGYKWFLDANSMEVVFLDYFWNHNDNAFRQLEWTKQADGLTWHPFTWSGGPVVSLSSEVYRISSQVDYSNSEIYSDLIPVEPGREYTVSYQVKTTDLELDQAKFSGAVLAGEYNSQAKNSDSLLENRVHDGQRDQIKAFSGTNDWTKIEYSFVTDPDTDYIRLRAMNGGWGESKGTVEFKNISFYSFQCQTCPSGLAKDKGNADCNNFIDLVDFASWLKVFKTGGTEDQKAAVDFDCSEGQSKYIVDLADFRLWLDNFIAFF